MSDFKVGDRVRIINPSGHNFSLGQEVTISDIDSSHVICVGVISSWGKGLHIQYLWGYQIEPIFNKPVKGSQLPTDHLTLKQVLDRYSDLLAKGLIIKE